MRQIKTRTETERKTERPIETQIETKIKTQTEAQIETRITKLNTVVDCKSPLSYLRIKNYLAVFPEIQIVDFPKAHVPDNNGRKIELIILDHFPETEMQQLIWGGIPEKGSENRKTHAIPPPEWILILNEPDPGLLDNPFLFGAFDVIIQSEDPIRIRESIRHFLIWKRKYPSILHQESQDGTRQLNQEGLDRIRERRIEWLNTIHMAENGFDQSLLDHICRILRAHSDQWMTAPEIAKQTGASNTTIRKYLALLDTRELFFSRMRYGKGRPAREYRAIKE